MKALKTVGYDSDSHNYICISVYHNSPV